MENHYLAVDVGGTKVKYGLVNHSGELVERGNQPTNRQNLKSFVAQLQAIIALYHDDIRGVGISLPVRVNHDTGTIHAGVMWSFLDGVDLKKALELDLPLAIENDGKAAALAELWVGELKGVANGLALVLGTGVGGGFVINGQLHYGAHYEAGELSFIYHKITTDRVSRFGFSGSAVEMIKEIATELELPDVHDGEKVFEFINAGYPQATRIFNQYAQTIALQIQNLQATVDIERVVIGGGISAQPIVTATIREAYESFYNGNPYINRMISHVDIVPGKFGNDANLYGAIYHLLLELNQEA